MGSGAAAGRPQEGGCGGAEATVWQQAAAGGEREARRGRAKSDRGATFWPPRSPLASAK